ncbi:MAG: sulfatase-like hydrolase/transferase, partial [Rubripirellula sp.]
HPGEIVEATVKVTNTGRRAGTEIAQLYVAGESFDIARPGLELKGFRRVSLAPGQSQTVVFQIKADDLSFHDASLNRGLPSGKYLVRVGGASADLGQPRTLVTRSQPRSNPLIASAVDTKRTHSGVPHSGVPHSGVPHSGVPHSGVPHSGVPHSGVPHSGVPHSGVPHSGVTHSGVPHSGVPSQAVKPDSMKAAEQRRPNVLFIAVDDLRPELGAYGTEAITPHIDRLASSGVRFDQAYCQQAVCGASRLSLMSGLYPVRTGEQTFHVSGWRDRHPELLTLNQHFGQQGYQTIGLGKIYHGHSGGGVDPGNWGRWVDVSAADYAKPENLKTLARVRAEGKVGDARDPAKGPLTESADVHDDTYMDGKRAAEATRILEDLASADGQPFFLAVGFAKPHLPFVAPKKYWDLYEREKFVMPPNQSIPNGYPEHAANLMAHEMHKYSDFEGDSPADFSDELNSRLLHGYAASTSYADACVGRVLDALEQTGLSDNTIVVLWGDHGWKLGDHGSWTKHTNFECDTRTPLIIRDPRLTQSEPTQRLVELIDLYPTLCDLTGVPVPGHCQGRSFRTLLTEPESGHRYDAYSSYPAYKMLGHSLRFGNYRYTEWRDDAEKVKARVLTNLKSDPGEVTNLVNDPKHADALARGQERLALRIDLARKPALRQQQSSAGRADQNALAVASVSEAKVQPTMTPPVSHAAGSGNIKSRNVIKLDVQQDRIRQSIDGFGGSIAFWGVNADDTALDAAINGLNVNILRLQGEVSKNGDAERNRDVLQRAIRINPDLQVLLTFWQPRSATYPDHDYWLDIVDVNGAEQFRLKPSREDEWADEMIARVLQYQKWGAKVAVLAVQNESNWSHPGTQTCGWEPLQLARFIEQKVRPRLDAAGLSAVRIAAPDLAYLGDNASEVQRFLPVLTSPSVEVAAYHMYDSFVQGQNGAIGILTANTRSLGRMRQQNFPSKRLWMTETTGAQWNGTQWHTYGWTEALTEHEKAVKAARYIHMTLNDAEANAFLWWGLVYSLAPERVTDTNTRQKHRDEGLVLVEEQTRNGSQAFLERTKKYYTFRQYSGFIRPGYQRLTVDSPSHLQVSAYCSPDQSKLVVVVINDSDDVHDVQLRAPVDYEVRQVRQTDEQRDCEPVSLSEPMSAKSVRTVVFER